MAVRFSADGQDYTVATGLGSQTNLTICSWVKLAADRNTWVTPWFLDANSTADTLGVQTNSDGTGMRATIDNASPISGVVQLAVGTWYFIAVSGTGVAGTMYVRALGAGSWTTATWSGGSSATTNCTTFRIGESPWTGEWLDGCETAVKVWTAELTQTELDAEWLQHTPARTADLAMWYPLIEPETTDYSGNGRTLSGGTGATQEEGPALSWGGPDALRWYLTNAAPGYAPATKRGGWDDASATLACGLGFTPQGLAATNAVAETTTTGAWDVLLGRWVSPPATAAGTLSGTVGWAVGVAESNLAADLVFHVHMFVTAGDTDTIRGTLLSDLVGASEWPTTAAGGGTNWGITDTAVQVGDRIVFEVGYRALNTSSTSFTGTLHYGNTGTVDLTGGSTAVTAQPGWVEFSAADALFAAPGNPQLVTLSGFEFGTLAGIVTGNAANRLFNSQFGAGTLAISTATPRTGDYYLDLTGAGNGRALRSQEQIGSGPDQIVVGVAIRFASLPTSDTNLLSMFWASGTGTQPVIGYQSSSGRLVAVYGSTVQGPTVTTDQWYWIDFHINGTANPRVLNWAVDGVTQTAGSVAADPEGLLSLDLGWLTNETQRVLYDDLVVSARGADYPLGPHKVVLVKPDTGGSTTEIGTANATARFTSNGGSLDTTHNSADILAAISEVPPTIGASADGVHQRTSGVGNAVEVPMTSYTLQSGETISGVRVLVCGWAATTTANNVELRGYDGVSEVVLVPKADPNFSNSTTAPAWLCVIHPQVEGWTQAKLDALTVRLGYSDDISPQPGAHAIYAEVAVKESAGGALVQGSGTSTVTAATSGSATVDSTLTNNADAGADGATVATSDTGSGDPWHNVSVGTGAEVVYDSGRIRTATGGTSALAYHGWNLPSVAEDYCRVDVNVASNASAERILLRYQHSGGQAIRITQLAAGTIRVRDSTNSTIATSTQAMPFAAAWRMEVHATFSATVGDVEVRLYADRSDPTGSETETLNVVASQNFGGLGTEIRFGIGSAQTNMTAAVMDNFASRGTTWFGPAAAGTLVQGSGTATSTASSSASGHVVRNAAGTATSTAATSATAHVVRNAAGTAQVTATSTGTARAVRGASGTSTSTAASTATGHVVAGGSGSGTTTAASTGTTRAVRRTTGAATSTASSTGTARSVLHAAGTGTSTADSTATAGAVRRATATATSTAVSAGVGVVTTHADGTSTATAASSGTGHVVRASAGTSTTVADSGATAHAVRHATATSTVTVASTGTAVVIGAGAEGTSTTTAASSGSAVVFRHAAGTSTTAAASTGTGTATRHGQATSTTTAGSSAAGHLTRPAVVTSTTTAATTGTGTVVSPGATAASTVTATSSGTGRVVRRVTATGQTTAASAGSGSRAVHATGTSTAVAGSTAAAVVTGQRRPGVHTAGTSTRPRLTAGATRGRLVVGASRGRLVANTRRG